MLFRAPGDDTDPISNKQDRDRRQLVLPPRDLILAREGGAIRLSAIERGSFISAGPLSSATKYLFYWAREADITTADGRAAAKARADLLDVVGRTYNDGEAIPIGLLTDAKYMTGYFLCVGADDQGNISERILATAAQSDAILDGTIPGPVTDLQVSEDGETANGTVVSVLAFTYVAPRPKKSMIGIQPIIRDYPAIGNLTEFSPLDYGGPDGGAGGGLLRIVPARRTGDGAISIAGTAVTGVGSHFTQFAKAGDQLEVFNTRLRILSVTDDLTMTLYAAWPANPTVAAVGEYVVIGRCRVYAVSLSQTYSHSNDDTTWPFVDVDLDGLLSPPNAPAVLTITPYGNGIRGQFQQVAGVGIRGYIVYRSTGTTDDITTATQVGKEIRHDPTTPNGGTVLQFEDSNFTAFEREQNQVFRYYVRTINIRDDPSATYATATTACRLDAPGDNSPTVPAREIALNQLWNGHINGTVGGPVIVGDAVQDVNMGGAAPAGRGRWYGAVTGVGSAPGHVSTTEVVLAMTGGVGPGSSTLQQDIGAVDNAVAANRRIPTWKMLHLQFKARTSGGAPNGTLFADIQQFDVAAALVATAGCVRRMPDDSIDTTQKFLAIAGSDIVSGHQIYHAAFVLDDTVQTALIRVRIQYQVTNWNGVNVFVTEAMLSIGEGLPQYTPQMADPAITFSRSTGGAPPIPPSFPPDYGGGRPGQPIQQP